MCVGMDVNRPNEKGQQVMEGTQPRLAPEPVLKSAGSHAFETSCTAVANSVVIKPGGARRLSEDLSDVCGRDANDEQPRNQCGLLASVMESRLSPSPMLNRIQCSRHVQGVLRCVGELERNAGSRRRRTGGVKLMR